MRWCTGRGNWAMFFSSIMSQILLRISHFHAPALLPGAAASSSASTSYFCAMVSRSFASNANRSASYLASSKSVGPSPIAAMHHGSCTVEWYLTAVALRSWRHIHAINTATILMTPNPRRRVGLAIWPRCVQAPIFPWASDGEDCDRQSEVCSAFGTCRIARKPTVSMGALLATCRTIGMLLLESTFNHSNEWVVCVVHTTTDVAHNPATNHQML
mmetsp:Transcript_79424/g.133007  ORF Transcript_79424/g.133007 Transcript_79424/m.133007 type:complete len:215 (-) Transcript_79424:51-695(-)